MNQTKIQTFLGKIYFLNIYRYYFSSPKLFKISIKYDLLKLLITTIIFNKKYLLKEIVVKQKVVLYLEKKGK